MDLNIDLEHAEEKEKSFLEDIEIGLGNWAWGDTFFWQQGKRYDDADSQEAFHTSL